MPMIHSASHRNWLLAIIQIYLPFVIWGSLIISFVVVSLTFIFRPIYSATTYLTLDADLSSVLREVDVSYPSTTSADYIRYEYFSTHNLSLMRMPQISEKLVDEWDIRNASGKRLAPEYMIEPSASRLIFSNDGQGVKVEWLSDTQQFIVTGYSKDPDKAVAYSRDYVDFFLEENSMQFRQVLNTLIERMYTKNEGITAKVEDLDQKIQQVKLKYYTSDYETELETLAERILEVKENIDELQLEKKTYQVKIDHLTQEAENYQKLKKIQTVLEINPEITSLKSDIKDLTGELIDASIDYTPQHPTYIAIEKKLVNAKETLKKVAKKTFSQDVMRVSGMLDTALATMLTLTLNQLVVERSLDHYDSILTRQRKRQDELTMVEHKVEVLTEQKEALLNTLRETLRNRYTIENIMSKTAPFFRVVSWARIDKDNLKYYKYFPKRKLMLLLTFVVSSFVLTFFVLARELHANAFYYSWQRPDTYKDIVCTDTFNLEIKEGLEHILGTYIHQICLATRDDQFVRIMSRTKGEGKATIGKSLARYFRRMGQSVVLVDGDVIHHSLSSSLGLIDRPGLAEVMRAELELDHVIIHDKQKGYATVPIGSGEMLADDMSLLNRATHMFSNLGTDFEKVIYIDAPTEVNPLMLADCLPPHAFIMVLKSGKHSIHDLEPAIETHRLTNGRATFKGLVLNKIPHTPNVFTWGGLMNFLKHVLTAPRRWLKG